MSQFSGRNRIVAIVIALILLLLALLLVRCQKKQPAPPETVTSGAPANPSSAAAGGGPGKLQPQEVLAPANLTVPAQVSAGKPFLVRWAGPNNAKDYITIVRHDAAPAVYGNYRDTSEGNPLELLAPIEPGEWEVRYVTSRSKSVLGKAPILVTANEVSLQGPLQVVAGASFQVTWTGPNNSGDYLTVVAKSVPDGEYRNYADTTKGSPLALTAPIEAGEAEIRYMTGQGAKVLHRIPVRVVAAAIDLDAPATVSAGGKVAVKWTGPGNAGDYITIVPRSLPDGQYAAYAYTDRGSSLLIDAPKNAGLGEIRYMSGQGAKVLQRRPIVITP